MDRSVFHGIDDYLVVALGRDIARATALHQIERTEIPLHEEAGEIVANEIEKSTDSEIRQQARIATRGLADAFAERRHGTSRRRVMARRRVTPDRAVTLHGTAVVDDVTHELSCTALTASRGVPLALSTYMSAYDGQIETTITTAEIAGKAAEFYIGQATTKDIDLYERALHAFRGAEDIVSRLIYDVAEDEAELKEWLEYIRHSVQPQQTEDMTLYLELRELAENKLENTRFADELTAYYPLELELNEARRRVRQLIQSSRPTP